MATADSDMKKATEAKDRAEIEAAPEKVKQPTPSPKYMTRRPSTSNLVLPAVDEHTSGVTAELPLYRFQRHLTLGVPDKSKPETETGKDPVHVDTPHPQDEKPTSTLKMV